MMMMMMVMRMTPHQGLPPGSTAVGREAAFAALSPAVVYCCCCCRPSVSLSVCQSVSLLALSADPSSRRRPSSCSSPTCPRCVRALRWTAGRSSVPRSTRRIGGV
ncbi:hypothetical protein CRUP_035581 [Coryphaenoides rupestris]|nr:hypothetical protein CRUP_035581 [Coryphaenoides rupestris]